MGQAAQCRPIHAPACCCCCPLRGGAGADGDQEAGTGPPLRASGRTVAGSGDDCPCSRCGRIGQEGAAWNQPDQPELALDGAEQLPHAAAAAFAAAQAALAKVAQAAAEAEAILEASPRLSPRGPRPELTSQQGEEWQRRLEKAGIRVRGDLPSTKLRFAASSSTTLPGENFDSVTPVESGATALSPVSTGEMCAATLSRASTGLPREDLPRPMLKAAVETHYLGSRTVDTGETAVAGEPPASMDDDDDADREASDAEEGEEPELPCEAPDGPLPSVGSAGHATGACKRCCFFPSGRCSNGSDCNFCHYEHERRRRGKRRSRATLGSATQEASAADAAWHSGQGAEAGIATPEFVLQQRPHAFASFAPEGQRLGAGAHVPWGVQAEPCAAWGQGCTGITSMVMPHVVFGSGAPGDAGAVARPVCALQPASIVYAPQAQQVPHHTFQLPAR